MPAFQADQSDRGNRVRKYADETDNGNAIAITVFLYEIYLFAKWAPYINVSHSIPTCRSK
ncbi:hypothetical protein YERSI8AC_290052 [Enterobacterales bacterium 8AC]|nr:hypothetical protein YERSI8AC_290052 [Enterobacterales bacterium 8AC]